MIKKAVTRALIFDEKGRILLGKRARGHGEGQWALIGGKPEAGESMTDCVIREVKEELGVDFTPELYQEVEDSESDYPNVWHVCYFKGPVSGQFNLKPDEISEVRYFSAADLKRIRIAFSHNRKLIEQLMSNSAGKTR